MPKLPTISVHPMYIRASACTNVSNVCSAYVGLRHHHQRVRDHAMCRFGFTNRIVRNPSLLGQRFLWTERHRYGKQQHARVRSTKCANWCSCSLNLEMGIRHARNPYSLHYLGFHGISTADWRRRTNQASRDGRTTEILANREIIAITLIRIQ